MNELKLFESINLINDDLIKEAELKPENKTKTIIQKRKIYAVSSAAAAVVITVGSVAFYNIHKSSKLPSDNTIISNISQANESNTIKSNTNESNTNKSIKDESISNKNMEDESISAESIEDKSIADESKTDNKNTSSQVQEQTEISENDISESKIFDEKVITEISAAEPTSQLTQPPQISTSESTSSINEESISLSECYFKKFSASSVIDPYIDYYGEDELHQVYVRVSGHEYYQLDISDYSDYNISADVSENDFGGFIGNIIETGSNTLGYPAESQEPNIAGAEVYYYAPSNSKSVIIVKKDSQCSIFVFSGRPSATFEECFNYYGAETSSDIKSISYTISVPDNSLFVTSSQGIITDFDTINSIVDILNQLEPETDESLAANSATPQWIIDAWDLYRANPDDYNAEDIMLEIRFNNGTVMKDIIYQPFIGNGCIEGMKELTQEQNKALRELLK